MLGLVIRTNNRWCHRVDIQRNLSDSRNEIPRRNRAPATDLRGSPRLLDSRSTISNLLLRLPPSHPHGLLSAIPIGNIFASVADDAFNEDPTNPISDPARLRSTKFETRCHDETLIKPNDRSFDYNSPDYVGKILGTDTKRVLNDFEIFI